MGLANRLAVTSLLLLGATPVFAADLDVRSAIDAVSVYPDGATVHRVIAFDAPPGETTLVARDLPPGLDARSVRIDAAEADGVAIASIDTAAATLDPPQPDAAAAKALTDLRDKRDAVAATIAALTAKQGLLQKGPPWTHRAPRMQVLELQQTLIEMQRDRDAAGNHVAEGQAAIASLERQRAQAEAQFVQDRTKEHLGQSDKAIIQYRRLLRQEIEKVSSGGKPFMFLDAANARSIQGPATMDGIGPTRGWETYWMEVDVKRRRGAPWGRRPCCWRSGWACCRRWPFPASTTSCACSSRCSSAAGTAPAWRRWACRPACTRPTS